MDSPGLHDSIVGRLTEVERTQAVTTADIRGIYAGLDEIRSVLVRMQEQNKPNLGGMFLALLATSSFFITVGGLSLAPIYRDLSKLGQTQTSIMGFERQILASRFTDEDGKSMFNDINDKIERGNEKIEDRLLRNEAQLFELQREVGKLRGIRE